MYTYNYKQPPEYHFSLDSIHLAEFIAEKLQTRKDLTSMRVLDLCAGCGVIGIELSWYVRELRQIDFVEIQDIYTHYFEQNAAIVDRPELKLRWHLLNYDNLLEKEWEAKYDLIVSNPPYFQPNQGMLSPSNFKNRCRFYLDSSFSNYIRAVSNTLAEGGCAYIILRPLKQHGNDLFSEINTLLAETTTSAKIIAQMRSADIILLEKRKNIS